MLTEKSVQIRNIRGIRVLLLFDHCRNAQAFNHGGHRGMHGGAQRSSSVKL